MKKKFLICCMAVILAFSVVAGGCKKDEVPEVEPEVEEDTTPVLFDTPAQSVNRTVSGMTLVFNDEFNGGSLDTEKWVYEKESWVSQNGAVQRYRNSNIDIADGSMNIRILNKSMAISDDDKGKNVTSGAIQTKGKYAQTYGRIEARMKLPTYTGAWPGFWMMPEDTSAYNVGTRRGWPYCGELDIMEGKGRYNTRVSGTVHTGYNADSNAQKSVGSAYYTSFSKPVDTFHIYALIWDADYMEFEVDGTVYQRITKEQWTSDHYKNNFPGNPSAPFDRDFYLTLSCGVGGIWDGYRLPGDLDSFAPAVMSVDYVRFYQFNKYLPTP